MPVKKFKRHCQFSKNGRFKTRQLFPIFSINPSANETMETKTSSSPLDASTSAERATLSDDKSESKDLSAKSSSPKIDPLQNDWREFECHTWHLEPTVRLISWAGSQVHFIDNFYNFLKSYLKFEIDLLRVFRTKKWFCWYFFFGRSVPFGFLFFLQFITLTFFHPVYAKFEPITSRVWVRALSLDHGLSSF